MRDFIADAAIYMVGRAVPALIGFLSVAVFVRVMGEHDYGLYSIIFAGINLMSTVAVGWLSQAILRFQSRLDQHAAPFAKTIAAGIVWACVAAVAGTPVLLAVTAIGLNSAVTFMSACLLMAGLTVHTAYTASLQAALRPRAAAAIEITRAVIALPASLLAMRVIHPPFVGGVLGLGIAYAITALLARHQASRSMPSVTADVPDGNVEEAVRGLFWFGWPISMWLGVSLLFPFGERFLIQRFLGPLTTGQYAATYDVVYRSCGFLLLPIVLAVHPRIMKEHALGRQQASQRLWRTGLVLQLLVAATATAVLTAVAPRIVALTGVRVTDATVSLVFPLAAAGCIWQIALMSHKLLEAMQQTRRMLAFLLVALVLDIAIDTTLLPRFGAVAAAYALLATGVLYNVCVGVDGLRSASVGLECDRELHTRA